MQRGGQGAEDHPSRYLLCHQEAQADPTEDQGQGVDRQGTATKVR